MSNIFLKIIPVLFFCGILVFVIFTVPYPESLTQANPTQLSFFFIPLFLALAFAFNIFLKNILSSFSVSVGLIFLLILKALDSLNLITGILIVLTVILLISYFSKKNSLLKEGYFRKSKKHLTSSQRIPKLRSL